MAGPSRCCRHFVVDFHLSRRRFPLFAIPNFPIFSLLSFVSLSFWGGLALYRKRFDHSREYRRILCYQCMLCCPLRVLPCTFTPLPPKWIKEVTEKGRSSKNAEGYLDNRSGSRFVCWLLSRWGERGCPLWEGLGDFWSVFTSYSLSMASSPYCFLSFAALLKLFGLFSSLEGILLFVLFPRVYDGNVPRMMEMYHIYPIYPKTWLPTGRYCSMLYSIILDIVWYGLDEGF